MDDGVLSAISIGFGLRCGFKDWERLLEAEWSWAFEDGAVDAQTQFWWKLEQWEWLWTFLLLLQALLARRRCHYGSFSWGCLRSPVE